MNQFYSKEEFEKDLLSKPLRDVTNKYLFDNYPFCFQDKPELLTQFRYVICDHFKIHTKNFCIVGSGKIGFSLSPNKYGSEFSEASDIDIVLISDELFQSLWLQLLAFQKTSSYKLSPIFKKKFNDLKNIFFYGIIRFDKLSNDFSFAKDWWEFFNNLSKDSQYGSRRIRAAIFKDWRYVSIYYEHSINKIKNKLEVDDESNSIKPNDILV